MTEEFPMPCPFCGDTPWFEGDGSDWKDDRRYVQMYLSCCSSMSSVIAWSKAREMTAEERTKEMKESLTRRWNKRYVKEEPILEGLYDNTQTYQRESYHNGELLSWVSASMTGNSTYLLGYEWDAPWGTYPDVPKDNS
jgi:hypothetical protein